MSVNKAILLGRVGREPEVRRTNDGKAIANLSLATSEKWKDKNSGEDKESTEWHRVTIFGRLAEIVEKYVNQGDQLYIEGKIKTRKWTDKENQERYTTEVVIDMQGVLRMLGGKKADSQQNEPQTASAQAPAAIEPVQSEPFDDDIPF